MEQITVYTPTYNRAYIIGDLYESLCNQSCQDFRWLIIDDGSTDDTRNKVESWKREKKIQIQYVYQENKGKLAAVNRAYEILETELNICMDSDDYLVENGIQTILELWNKNKDKRYAGLVGLNQYEDGTIVGTEFPIELKRGKFSEFSLIYGAKGDKKFIYRTDIVKKYGPYPNINNEIFPAPGYLYRLIDQKYDLLLVNEVFSVVRYLPDGISSNKLIQLKENPHSFMFYRLERMRLAVNLKDLVKNAIHFNICCLLANTYTRIFKNKYTYITLPLFPISILVYIYLNYTDKKGVI